MNRTHKRRLYLLLLVMFGITSCCGLIFYALQQNINLFYTPDELLQANLKPGVRVRVGGMVLQNSLHYRDDLQVTFTISDYKKELPIVYRGIVPDLFREGQGVVALGKLGSDQIFVADQILAKHDENYMPPELTKKLAQVQHDP